VYLFERTGLIGRRFLLDQPMLNNKNCNNNNTFYLYGALKRYPEALYMVTNINKII